MAIETVTAQDLHAVVSHHDDAVLCIDVRTPEEYAASHIAGVENIPLEHVGHRMDELKKYKTVYVHCASGNRSKMACDLLDRAGVAHVCNVDGGMFAWNHCKLPTVCAQSEGTHTQQLPLMRQVMIVAGSLVLFGLFAGAFVHPLFTLLTWIVGLGLVYGGSTGNCLMMKLLLKAPWNCSIDPHADHFAQQTKNQ